MVCPSLSGKIKDRIRQDLRDSSVARAGTQAEVVDVVQFESTRLALEADRDAARNELRLCNDRSGSPAFSNFHSLADFDSRTLRWRSFCEGVHLLP